MTFNFILINKPKPWLPLAITFIEKDNVIVLGPDVLDMSSLLIQISEKQGSVLINIWYID